MEISRRIDYGIRVILDLVTLPRETRVSTEEISLRQQIPNPFLAKIISQLSLSGLITTYRGPSGGVQLARPPAEISLLQVIEALEGPIRLNRCTTQPDLCPLEDRCPVRDVWLKAQETLVELLAETTFDRLAQRHEVSQ